MNLVIEVTRKCNLSCDHCLRGCSQNMDMKKEYIEDTIFYLNCNGMIINGCDWSYDTQDNNPDIQICKVDELAKTLKDNIPECQLQYI